ncbi:membrane protein insertase, YidC/Oxa1 family, C-terminal domain-containing protein [Lachnospiraceae bacterium XBD2001]|nr:membrane protein insertase, YidC/Oxa1 family, C-terminal domain-containing protein [Lachnospiraceae bacterium XBD2001]
MTFAQVLHTILIAPLSLFFEVVYAIAYRVIHNPGLSIVALSLAMNFLVLPLYKRADAMQEEQRDIEMKLQPWIRHIKKNFKGDERMMMLQTYYRQNNYKPTDALKGSVSLLLEVPFFIAAYQFLSGLQMLNGISFGPIKDLGAPDGMLVVAGVAINVLPILMTTINFISGAIYTKGFPLKSKIQLYGMALIFLVFLYQSPAGLVFYWTLNNLFSLVKNIFYKLKNPKKVLAILFSLVGILAVAVGILRPWDNTKQKICVIAFGLLLQLPLLLQWKKVGSAKEYPFEKKDTLTFVLGGCFLAVLSGLLIPVSVIHSSPAEFVNIMHYSSPLHYVAYSSCLAFGLFVVWFGIFFWLGNGLGRKVMAAGIWVLSGWAVVNYMFFGTKNGTLSTLLHYDHLLHYSMKQMLINLVVLCGVTAVFYLVWWKNRGIVHVVYAAAMVALVGMSISNMYGINTQLKQIKTDIDRVNQDMATIPLSTKGQNVMVIMLDRAMGLFVPYLMQEDPNLMAQFDGFTFYPNSVSFGPSTNFGTPGLFGGYDYTPENMNRRDNLLLEEKQNEALTLMPRLFDEAGYNVTVCDPPYAGYEWIPDLSIYDEYPGINAYVTKGRFNQENAQDESKNESTRLRNFFCYSIFKISPLALQPTVYNEGNYNCADAGYLAEHPSDKVYTIDKDFQGSFQLVDAHHSIGLNRDFIGAYFVLKNLSEITEITDQEENTFLMMDNDSTHDVTLLQEPEYEPEETVDNELFDETNAGRFTIDGQALNVDDAEDYMHYQCMMASFKQLGAYFDYMREQGVYDNTRIILVSDHGSNVHLLDDVYMEDGMSIYSYNCLMMVKDYNSKGYTVSDTLMTNADTPALALEGVIDNPVNPYTKNPINMDGKNTDVLHLFKGGNIDIKTNNGYRFEDNEWYGLKNGNALDLQNWSSIEDPSR